MGKIGFERNFAAGGVCGRRWPKPLMMSGKHGGSCLFSINIPLKMSGFWADSMDKSGVLIAVFGLSKKLGSSVNTRKLLKLLSS